MIILNLKDTSLRGPLNQLNAILSLFHPLDRSRNPSAIGSAIGRRYLALSLSRAAKRGCFKRGGFPIWTCPSFFVLFCPFWDFPDFSGIFPICSRMARGFSRFVLFLFLGLLRAPTRNSPERVRDTIWTFPEKSGKHPGLETPRFSFSQISLPHTGRASLSPCSKGPKKLNRSIVVLVSKTLFF